jgi:hypothetical protein
MKSKLLSINYLGPIQYYAHLFSNDKIFIEANCNYNKQTYRNRCVILAANGPLSLVIPIAKGDKLKCLTKDVRISYDTPWQALHWKSIESAYNSSPYFEYFMDDFRPFYEKKFGFLFDYNISLMEVVFDSIGFKPTYSLTDEYVKNTDEKWIDLRELIHPKNDYKTTDPEFKPKSYRQLFLNKHGFVENLSIIDLLFNKGPESLIVLQESKP